MKYLAFLCDPDTMWTGHSTGCLWNFLVLPVKIAVLSAVFIVFLGQMFIWELTHGAPDWRQS